MILTASEILNAGLLIVDDQESNISLLEHDCWAEAGYTRLASTMNPLEVCALHRQNQYDLILLDLHRYPSWTASRSWRGLKADSADDYLPVLVLTAQPGHKLRANHLIKLKF